MEQLINGKYYYQDDFNFEITEGNKISILNEIKQIFENEKDSLLENYRQGFILVYSETEIIILRKQLDYLFRQIFNELFNLTRLKEALNNAKRNFIKKYDEDYLAKNIYPKIYKEIKARVYALLMDKHTSYILKIKDVTLNIIFNLPSNVKALIFDKPPLIEFKEALCAKNIPYIITNKKLHISKKYYINIFTNEISEQEIILKHEAKPHKKTNLKLGQNLWQPGLFEVSNKTDFILVETDKAYLLSKENITLESRTKFYQELYQKYPDKQIIISLPKLDVLFKYHHIDYDYLMDEKLLARYFYLYEIELKSILVNSHNNIKICLPPVVDDTEFKYVKLQIQTFITSTFNKKIKLGLALETETSFEYLDYYKKYDFVFMNIDRLINETDILESMDEQELIKELSNLNQRLKIKYKSLYIAGSPVNNYSFYQKLIRKGFRNFVVPNSHLNKYYRFNMNEN